MKRFAQIEYGKAHWVFEAEEKPEFAPNIVLVDITNRPEIQEGWAYDELTGNFTPPQPSKNHFWDGEKWVIDIDKLKDDKRAEIADARWRVETGGITIDGVEIATDRESQAKIQAVALTTLSRLLKDSLPVDFQTIVDKLPAKVNWKGKSAWLDLDDSKIISTAMAVFNHVQNAYNKEKEIQSLIDAATTVAELEAVKWE